MPAFGWRKNCESLLPGKGWNSPLQCIAPVSKEAELRF